MAEHWFNPWQSPIFPEAKGPNPNYQDPSATGGFSNFRRSDNIDDRRGGEGLLSWLQAYAQFPSMAEWSEIINNPMTPVENLSIGARYTVPKSLPPPSPLAISAGYNDIQPALRIPIDFSSALPSRNPYQKR
jgi:hypothetical protein